MWHRFLRVLLLLHTVGMLLPDAQARPHRARPRPSVLAGPGIELPFITNRTCRAGSIRLTFTNWGTIGSESGNLVDPCTGLPAVSSESPRNSGIEYLFQGGLWIGGVRGRDTLVSVGVDGWQAGISELLPAPFPEGDFIERTTRDSLSHAWDEANLRWRPGGHAVTLDSLLKRYADLDSALGYPFHPDSFPVADLARALLLEEVDPRDPSVIDTVYVYFEPYGGNLAADDRHVLQTDSSGLNMARIIYKPFPDALPGDLAYREDGTPFKPYYEYQYELDGMYMAEPVYIAVTAFDFGDPLAELEPQESYLFNNVQHVHPGALAASNSPDRPTPGLFPNPYHKRDDYRGSGWESPARLEPDPERARRITFYNLPDTCTIRIWTLDGDLVRELYHAEPSGSADASFQVWNVITRNGQKATTGLYIWAVESRFGTDVGKLAVIR